MGAQVFQEEIDKLVSNRPALEPLIETPAGTYLKLAINTTKLRKNAFTSLDKLLKEKDLKFAFADNAPFSIASKVDATKIITYPNIPRLLEPDKLADHASEMWSDGRKRKKIEEHARAESYVLKREVTTLGKFLMKYSNLQTLGYRDDQIRSFCEKLAVETAPPSVFTCETPEDYHTMFKVKTGSCMEVGSSYWQEWSSKSLKQIAEDTGIFMASWYHWAPWCKGAYIVVGGVPVARFMLYREDLDRDVWPFYGDVRGSSVNYTKVMTDWLAERGIKRYDQQAKTLCEFRIPGFKHFILEREYGEDQMFCPIGNMDNQAKDFGVVYDESTNEFVFAPKGKLKGALNITDTYAYRGFLKSSQVPKYIHGKT